VRDDCPDIAKNRMATQRRRRRAEAAESPRPAFTVCLSTMTRGSWAPNPVPQLFAFALSVITGPSLTDRAGRYNYVITTEEQSS
jgi:hypothetical protein